MAFNSLRKLLAPSQDSSVVFGKVIKILKQPRGIDTFTIDRYPSDHRLWGKLHQLIETQGSTLLENPDLFISFLQSMHGQRLLSRLCEGDPFIFTDYTRKVFQSIRPFYEQINIIVDAHFLTGIDYAIACAFNTLNDMPVSEQLRLLAPLSTHISNPPALFGPLSEIEFDDQLAPFCIPDNFNDLDRLDIQYFDTFARDLNAAFGHELDMGIALFNGFVIDPEDYLLEHSLLFIENPFIGNMGLHSPIHPFRFFMLTKLLPHISPKELLKRVLKSLTCGRMKWTNTSVVQSALIT